MGPSTLGTRGVGLAKPDKTWEGHAIVLGLLPTHWDRQVDWSQELFLVCDEELRIQMEKIPSAI